MGNTMCSINSVVEGRLPLIYTQVLCFLAENLWSSFCFEQQSLILVLQVVTRRQQDACSDMYVQHVHTNTILYLHHCAHWHSPNTNNHRVSVSHFWRKKFVSPVRNSKMHRTLNPSRRGIRQKEQQQNSTKGKVTSNNPLGVLYEEVGSALSWVTEKPGESIMLILIHFCHVKSQALISVVVRCLILSDTIPRWQHECCSNLVLIGGQTLSTGWQTMQWASLNKFRHFLSSRVKYRQLNTADFQTVTKVWTEFIHIDKCECTHSETKKH